MSKLRLSVAVGDYDRTHALIDGSVSIDGVNSTGDAVADDSQCTFREAITAANNNVVFSGSGRHLTRPLRPPPR